MTKVDIAVVAAVVVVVVVVIVVAVTVAQTEQFQSCSKIIRPPPTETISNKRIFGYVWRQQEILLAEISKQQSIYWFCCFTDGFFNVF